MYQQEFQQYQQQFQPASQVSGADEKKYISYFSSATPAQFKPVKLYVLFNDATSKQCLQSVHTNSDLNRRVEVIDAARVENRPQWLKGVPSLMDESGQFFLGPECVMWIRYQANQAVSSVSEGTGVSQIMEGAPAVIDGTAKMAGSISKTSFVPQQMVSDRDLMQSMGGQQQYESAMTARAHAPQITPPSGWTPGQKDVPKQFQPQQTRNNGNAEKLNSMIEAVQSDRGALLNQPRVPHHQQQRFGWNPGSGQVQQNQQVRGPSVGDQRLQQLQQERGNLGVSMRTI